MLYRATPSVWEKICQIRHNLCQNLHEWDCVPCAEQHLPSPDSRVLFDKWEELFIPNFNLVGLYNFHCLKLEAGLLFQKLNDCTQLALHIVVQPEPMGCAFLFFGALE